MLRYKLEEIGINVELVNEAYTSKCSFLDGEEIGKHETYCGRRVKRGLFKSKENKLLNADVNGSYNILRLGMEIPSSTIKMDVPFNPIKIRDINAISDVCYFRWNNRPTDRRTVSVRDGVA